MSTTNFRLRRISEVEIAEVLDRQVVDDGVVDIVFIDSSTGTNSVPMRGVRGSVAISSTRDPTLSGRSGIRSIRSRTSESPTRATNSVRFASLLILPGFLRPSGALRAGRPDRRRRIDMGRPPVGADSFCAEQCRTRQIDELPTGTPDPALHRLHAHTLVLCDLGETELCILAQHDSDPKLFG